MGRMAPEEESRIVGEVEKVVGGERSGGEMFETGEEMFETGKDNCEKEEEIGPDGEEANGLGRDVGNEKENEPDDEKKGSGSKAMAGDDSGSLAEVSSCAGSTGGRGGVTQQAN